MQIPFYHRFIFFYFYLIIYLFICFSLVPWAGAVEFSLEEQAFIEKQPSIRVHNETAWPPFNFNQNGKAQGISIDVMNRVSEIAGLSITYVTGPSWAEFMKMMADKKLDVMLNIIDLPERRDLLRFTTPYAKSLTGVFATNENSRTYFDFEDLTGKIVAVPAGFDLEINVPKYHPNVKVLLVRDILECIDAVRSGRAHAFMEEIGVVDYIMSQRMVSDVRLAFQVSEEAFTSSLTIATARENDLLHTVIQKSLNAISDDELHRIRKKWLLKTNEIYDRSMLRLTVKEKEYLYRNNQVNICVDPSWPPLDFIAEDGSHKGLSADLSQRISKRTGLKLNLVPTTTWEQSLKFIQEGGCDVIPLMNETLESKSYIDFTQPYFNFATVIAARDDASFIGGYSELEGKTVALQAYFFITEYVREHYPKIRIVEVENTREALKLVSEQKAFATIDGLPGIVNTIEALALENIKIVGSVPQENKMKLGVRKGNDLLLSIFSKGIASLSEKEKIGLYKKWFDIEVSNQFFNRSFILKIGAGGFFILILLIWRQYILKRYTTKLTTLNEKLRYAATFDHLTGILNRKSIEKRLEIEVEKSGFSSEPLTIVMFDIDHFKTVNDSFGHMAGDIVLKKMAGFVQKTIRRSDHFGRWGGEEFLIILPNTEHRDADKIMHILKNRIEKYDFSILRPVTVSMGIGQLKKKETPTSFLTRIDNCLYAAKDAGRNKIVNAEVSIGE